MQGSRNGRNIGSHMARKVEGGLDLPHGWMDQEHDRSPGEEEGRVLKLEEPRARYLVYNEPLLVFIPEVESKLAGGRFIRRTLNGGMVPKVSFFPRDEFPQDEQQGLVATEVLGHAMAPEIPEGTRVVIQPEWEPFRDHAIYALGFGEAIVIRKLARLLDGRFRIISHANGVQGEDQVGLLNELNILGRVIWIGHRV